MQNLSVPRVLVLTLAVSAAASCATRGEAGADLILTGGIVHAEIGAPTDATALAITGGRIEAVGDDAGIRALAGENTQEMPLDGAAVMPGLSDAWLDVAESGRWSTGLDVRRAATPRELQALVRAAASAGSGWIIGWGWDETRWPAPRLPGPDLLDAPFDRPVLLYRHAGRIAWANGPARRVAGLPADACVVTGPELQALEAAVPQDAGARREWLLAGLQQAAAAGFTRIATGPMDAADWELLRSLSRGGELPVRVHARLRADASLAVPPGADGELLEWAGYAIELDDPLAPELRNTIEREALVAAMEAACRVAAERGLPLAVHVHGETALQVALSCAGLADGSGLIVGADAPGDIVLPERARVAVVPTRLAHDLPFLESLLGRGAARAHPYRELASAGHLAAIASVAPAYPLEPMAALRIMFTRRDQDGYPLDGWHPEQRLAVADSLRAMVRSAITGVPSRLAPGEPADLVVWSENPLGDPELLSRALPLLTMVNGRVMYSRPWVVPEGQRR